ncbi:M15 family metallopeptidase [Metabacillus fastidiosus]|nr:M15 family metallopeptidase [Metabacillus fastidiosus]
MPQTPFFGDKEGKISAEETDKTKTNPALAGEQIDEDFLLESKYFNIVKNVDSQPTIANPENVLALVNKEFALPATYEPDDLVIPNVEFSFGKADVPQRYIRKEAAAALEGLFEQAEKEGIELLAVSGYRSYSRQLGVLNNEEKKKGKELARQTVALPGQSEHQSGLAMDVSSRSNNLELSEAFGETEEGKWLRENAHRFGYIIRYQKGKEEITGYQYEPWHLRYVGVERAKVIFEHDMTLEEYFKKAKAI